MSKRNRIKWNRDRQDRLVTEHEKAQAEAAANVIRKKVYHMHADWRKRVKNAVDKGAITTVQDLKDTIDQLKDNIKKLVDGNALLTDWMGATFTMLDDAADSIKLGKFNSSQSRGDPQSVIGVKEGVVPPTTPTTGLGR